MLPPLMSAKPLVPSQCSLTLLNVPGWWRHWLSMIVPSS